MNTPEPTDPRTLAHRLTAVSHALHHRVFAHLRDAGIPPKTLLLLRAVDGRVDSPWVADRLTRGGKRLSALADRGWITREGDVWSLTPDGRALLDRADADRSAILADVPAEQLANLAEALDTLAATLGVDAAADRRGPRGGFRVELGAGPRGFGPGSRPAFGPNDHHGFRPGDRPGPRGPRGPLAPAEAPAAPDADDSDHPSPDAREHRGHVRVHGRHEGAGGRPHHGRRREERAYERGFDAGFQRGAEAGGAAPDPRA